LHAGGGLAQSAPLACPPSRYRYDPAAPTPALGGPSAQRKPRVRQRSVEERPDVLTFTTEALRDPLEVIGAVRAPMYLRSSVDHTDVVVRLCDVHRTGRSVNICDGIQRVTPDEYPADDAGVRQVDVALWPTAHRFGRGHRVRVQIASAAFPRFARNPETGAPPTAAAHLVPTDREVLHQPGHASHVVLPVAATGSPSEPRSA
jgi:uncharacterized protein